MQVTIKNLHKMVGEMNGSLEWHNTIVAGNNAAITRENKWAEEAEKELDPWKTKRLELT
jgi:hypothetical protein